MKREEELLREIREMVKETKAGKICWKIIEQTTEYNEKEKKPVVFCGDLNVAHKEIDLKNPKTNRRNAGFTDEEREKFTQLLEHGFIDTFRYFYPDQEGIYSWWSYRFRAREKNVGWRIDYFIVSEALRSRLESASIHQEISDAAKMIKDSVAEMNRNNENKTNTNKECSLSITSSIYGFSKR